MPAFMNVEDDTTGEEGVDYTGESATSLMEYQLQIPWDGLQYNDRDKVSLARQPFQGELEKQQDPKNGDTYGKR